MTVYWIEQDKQILSKDTLYALISFAENEVLFERLNAEKVRVICSLLFIRLDAVC